jgi:16S rRNA processing protein RimM
VYIVDTGGKPLLIPALRQVVKEIDLAGRRMVVDLPEGLMDN